MPVAGSTGSILGLDHVAVAVPRLDAAIATYEVLFEQPAATRGEGWARFELANAALVLTEGRTGLAFAVAEPEGALRLLERRGLPAMPERQEAPIPLDPAAARGLHLMLAAARAGGGLASAIRLDHAVIRSTDPERTLALFGGRLGLELRLDRSNPDWGMRLLFFRCGELVIEVSHALADGIGEGPDSLWGLTWRVPDVGACHARLEAAGLPVSPLRTGRKPGTRIFTLRGDAAGLATAFIGA
jgi:catechol 2,3-dioxygenase-like lactoylglutathione lyase family enzyme